MSVMSQRLIVNTKRTLKRKGLAVYRCTSDYKLFIFPVLFYLYLLESSTKQSIYWIRFANVYIISFAAMVKKKLYNPSKSLILVKQTFLSQLVSI
jgi:hypothetical protein